MSVQPRRADLTAPATDTVRLEGVRFGYADGPDVLRDVNLILPAGSFHFLTGPSGSGKSTLLKLFRSLNRLGATVLIASHDERVAADSGATVLRLDGGRLAGGAA